MTQATLQRPNEEDVNSLCISRDVPAPNALDSRAVAAQRSVLTEYIEYE
jgi:hypothetical protein